MTRHATQCDDAQLEEHHLNLIFYWFKVASIVGPTAFQPIKTVYSLLSFSTNPKKYKK